MSSIHEENRYPLLYKWDNDYVPLGTLNIKMEINAMHTEHAMKWNMSYNARQMRSASFLELTLKLAADLSQ